MLERSWKTLIHSFIHSFATQTRIGTMITSTALNVSAAALACSPSSIPYPNLFGAKFLTLETTLVQNYSRSIATGLYINHGSVDVVGANFCNVTVSYTHPGQNDTIVVQVWLPAAADDWNGRLQMLGGGGYQAGLTYASLGGMTAAIGEGYSTVSTDAGLGSESTPVNWGLLSPGNVNMYLLQDLASVSLNDAAVIGKAISNSYYGKPPAYSYFSGCSQGGRQGMMLAQRYPDAFDGIAASAPAINWGQLFPAMIWPSWVLNQQSKIPPTCEFDAITTAVLAACDGNDGLIDGIVTNPNNCTFDVMSMVGQTINCTNDGISRQISSAAAITVEAAYSGMKGVDNSSLWYGINKGATLTGSVTDQAILMTTCTANGTCTPGELELGFDWIKYFVAKNPDFGMGNLTHKEFERLAHLSVQMYGSIISTDDPDLSAFKARGGKILGYHGLSDSIITPNGTLHYYDAVSAMDPNVQDFYRLFLAPGLNHCFGGLGPYPDSTFDTLRKWVEEGVVPETLNATTVGTTTPINRPLCPYPKLQYFNGTGDGTTPDGFYCM